MKENKKDHVIERNGNPPEPLLIFFNSPWYVLRLLSDSRIV